MTDDRIERRAAGLLPEEHAAGSADPRAQAEAILADSDRREHRPDPVEDRREERPDPLEGRRDERPESVEGRRDEQPEPVESRRADQAVLPGETTL